MSWEHVHFDSITVLLSGSATLTGVTAVAASIETDSSLTLTDGELTNSSVRVTGGRALLSEVRFDGSLTIESDTVRAPLLISEGSATISSCRITGSSVAGARVEAAADSAVSLTGCDIHDNAGAGVHNLSPHAVAAEQNWWGDPAGPLGPDGDGVSGSVDYEPYRTEPAFP